MTNNNLKTKHIVGFHLDKDKVENTGIMDYLAKKGFEWYGYGNGVPFGGSNTPKNVELGFSRLATKKMKSSNNPLQ